MDAREPHPYLGAHVAKLAFRALLPLFARFWSDARANAPEDSLNAAIWPGYERLLRACQDILSHAPMHPNEAKQNVEPRYVRSLERLATMLASLFPHGFAELETYVIADEVQEWRRSHGVVRRHRRAKARRRRKR